MYLSFLGLRCGYPCGNGAVAETYHYLVPYIKHFCARNGDAVLHGYGVAAFEHPVRVKRFKLSGKLSDTVFFFDYDPASGKLTADGHVLTHKRPLAIYW